MAWYSSHVHWSAHIFEHPNECDYFATFRPENTIDAKMKTWKLLETIGHLSKLSPRSGTIQLVYMVPNHS